MARSGIPQVRVQPLLEINLAPGAVSEDADIIYRAQQGHTISGTVALKSGGAPPGAKVDLLDPGSGIVLQSATAMFGSPEFTLYGIADGEYEIEASTSEKLDKSRMISPKQRVKVKGEDVDGLELVISSLGLIQVTIALETPGDHACRQPLKMSRLSFEAMFDSREKSDERFRHAEAVPDEKGMCLLLNLIAGRYRLNLTGLGANWYLKQITDSKLNDSGLISLPAGGRAEVGITLASGAATLSGKAPAKSRIYLVPDKQIGALKPMPVRTALTKDDGTFTIGNLAPGSYHIFSRATSAKEETPISAEELPQIKKDAETKGMVIELKPCQQLTEVGLP